MIKKIKPLVKDKKFKIVREVLHSGKKGKPIEIEKKVSISHESDMLKISLLDS